MKRIASFLVVSGALILAASCNKIVENPEVIQNDKEITISILASDKPEVETETKTYLDGTSVKWSSTGEYLKVYEVATPTEGDATTTSAPSAEGNTEDGGSTMSFGVTLADKSEGYSSFDYYAVYPSSATQPGSDVNALAINTKAAQTPSATNFDPTQDLLIAKKIEGQTSQANTLNMQFARVVAIGEMTIKNLQSTEDITKITFSAKEGETAIKLAGRTTFNLETAKPVRNYANNVAETSIVLNYEGQGITANTAEGMTAYFVCYPFALNARNSGSFKVVVETATKTFEREITLEGERELAFNIGKASLFSLDFTSIAGSAKEVDLRYAYLDYADFTGAGGTNSYGNITANKAHGDSWVMYAIGTNNAIGVRKNDDTNDSYIKLPDFKETIKTVVVTLKNPTASKTITLETSATGTEGSISSLTTNTETVYTFDIESESVKTAYFRSNGFQAQVEKIEVYAGEDDRTQLSEPTSISAAVNSEKANSIDVSWGEVSGAGSYIVTLESTGNDDVVVETDLLAITVPLVAGIYPTGPAARAVPVEAASSQQQGRITITGVVRDAAGEPVAGAMVMTKDQRSGTLVNPDGTLYRPEGSSDRGVPNF